MSEDIGDDPAGDPADPGQAARWVAAYLELDRWLDRILTEDDMDAALRARLSRLRLRLRIRLDFWQRRVDAAAGPYAEEARVLPMPIRPRHPFSARGRRRSPSDLDQPLANRVDDGL